ncbi:MAG: phosphate/phosphite/phosphonate ABC transporter substrate-binding protein [Gammaproteobacteria bacterium]|nr:phosphate/phosphite/phosphonate ABC transporter substrate-binding protein [Gammaproteobacteria bacterium]NNF60440.1 phosphate/phosphite/phosphonate ABC transporter substrate-binding protein [Gammaproteobacteria bacterium]NNM21786.1 phosphate/phosphite/phosphonate ABC transporter substrate-binding protein [Gammaproteobacteria bacterium]
MLHITKHCFSVRLVLAMLLAGWSLVASAQERVLVLGAIHADLEGRYAELRPMADYVAAALADAGVTRVDVMVVEDRRRLARMMRDGRIDWVSENVANAVYLQEAAGVQILARKWKQGAPQFRSVFFTRSDGDITSLGDLAGRTLAFIESDSTAGHLLPAAELIREGHRTVALETPRQQSPAGTIGYAFAGSDINATTWVHKRIVDAGVLSNVDWESDSSLPEFFRKDFVIFHQTDSMPRALELVRGDLDEDIKNALRSTLLGMDKDSGAARALQAYQGTLRFDELGEVDHETLRKLRSTFAQLMLVN